MTAARLVSGCLSGVVLAGSVTTGAAVLGLDAMTADLVAGLAGLDFAAACCWEEDEVGLRLLS